MVIFDINLQNAQELNLTPSLIHAIEMLSLNCLEIDQLILKKSYENVFLDITEKEDKFLKNILERKTSKLNNQTHPQSEVNEEFSYEGFISNELTFTDYLKGQARLLELDTKQREIVLYLIDNLDSKGYLPVDIGDLKETNKFNENEIYNGISVLQSLDPKGVGARNLKENLLLQCEKDSLMSEIINENLIDIANNRLEKISSERKIDVAEVQELKDKIQKLNPIPSSGFIDQKYPLNYIIPDILVKNENGYLSLEYIDSYKNSVDINSYYLKLLEKTNEDEIKDYLKEQYSKALFFLDSLETRKKNIKLVTESIVDWQKDFFIKQSPLKELKMEDISELTNLSVSTISRISTSKYLQCDNGVFELKYFFINKASTAVGVYSKDEVMKEIKLIIEQENCFHPYSDSKIKQILEARGYNISRRTTTKYRKLLGIQASAQRRRF